jgi:hypothetical protein
MITTTMTSEAMASKGVHPVIKISTAAAMTANEPSKSPSTSK